MDNNGYIITGNDNNKYVRTGTKGAIGFRGRYGDEDPSSYKEQLIKIKELYDNYYGTKNDDVEELWNEYVLAITKFNSQD